MVCLWMSLHLRCVQDDGTLYGMCSTSVFADVQHQSSWLTLGCAQCALQTRQTFQHASTGLQTCCLLKLYCYEYVRAPPFVPVFVAAGCCCSRLHAE
jgi:hypothetical protein